MRCNKLYLNDVVEEQGKLFAHIVERGIDLEDFVQKYFNSAIRKKIDEGSVWHCTRYGYEIIDLLIEQEGMQYKQADYKQDEWVAEWIGCFYAKAQWILNISSKELIKKAPYKDVYMRYNTLHDIDLDLAIEKYFHL